MRVLWLPSYFDEWSGASFVMECMQHGPVVELVLCMSDGGYVAPGLAISDAIETHVQKAVFLATGMCASSATVAFTAAKSPARRFATRRASFLLHPVRMGVIGRLPDAIAEVAYASELQDLVSGHYLEAGVNREVVDRARTEEVFLNAQQALACGLIGAIR